MKAPQPDPRERDRHFFAFSPDSSLLAVLRDGGGLILLDARTGAPQSWDAEGKDRGRLQAVVFSPDGNVILVGRQDRFQAFAVSDGKLRPEFPIRGSTPQHVGFRENGEVLEVVTTGGKRHRWTGRAAG